MALPIIDFIKNTKQTTDVLEFLYKYQLLFIMFIIIWSVVLLVLYNFVYITPEDKEKLSYNNSVIVNTVLVIIVTILIAYSYTVINTVKSTVFTGIKDKIFNLF